MKESDVNRRARIFDRPNDSNARGIIGTVIEVITPTSFRFKTDPSDRNPTGREYVFTIGNDDEDKKKVGVQVHWLDGDA